MLKRTATRANSLVLTFDDGRGSRLTTDIMYLLDKNNAKASFFLSGKSIAGRENIIRTIAERGHEICSHGYNHLNYWTVSPWRALADINKGWKAIDAALGLKRKKYPFRPPYGKLNIVCLLYLLARHVPIIYWTIDSGDTWKIRPGSDTIAEAVKKGGAVALAHDFDREDEKTNKFVLDSIQSALEAARDNGMQLMTVSELMDINK